MTISAINSSIYTQHVITIYYLLESDFLQEKFEGIKLIIRSLIRSRTYITKKNKDKKTNDELQNTAQKQEPTKEQW